MDAEPLSPELRDVLMPAVPRVVDAAMAAIRGQGLDIEGGEALEKNLRIGLIDAVDRWFNAAAPSSESDLHLALGRAQARAGRGLDELMSFYRVAARTMWRRIAEVGSAAGIEPEQLYRLAETGFGWVEELSMQAAEGYAEEQLHRSGASLSRRTELVRLLLRRPQPPVASLVTVAHDAGLELTRTLAFFVGPAEQYNRIARSPLDNVVLGPREGEFVGAVLDPDGPGRRHQLAAAAARAGVRLALGPVVPLAEAHTSLSRASALHRLMRAGLVETEQVADVNSHAVALLLSAEPGLAHDIATHRLAPLDAVRGEQTRQNLQATLGAWLRQPGRRKTIAHELGVHPQTVRYRVGKLRELFGTSLEDPEQRFELQLALRLRPYATLDPTTESAGAARHD
ncbi:MAG: PucR family transcriptional regulator [Solirubrobacteraceae bacterium]|nr:MAG: hypothetical protein DLM63_07975 [Solirubrobacterales bacterium]